MLGKFYFLIETYMPEQPDTEKYQSGSRRAIEVLRIGIGVIWAFNLYFIVEPSAQYFATFQSVAAAYGPETLGGPGIADFVAAHSLFFAWAIAIVSFYLAAAFILGFTTRVAMVVGAVASVFFFLTQWVPTFMLPGGTDVGAHPLYIAIYIALFLGGAGSIYSLDSVITSKLGNGHRWLGILFNNKPVGSIRDLFPSFNGRGEATVRSSRVTASSWMLAIVIAAAIVSGYAFVAGYGDGTGVAAGNSNNGMGSMSGGNGPYYVDLAINAENLGGKAVEQCSPANFTVPSGTLLIFVIKNYYSGLNPASSPYDQVFGTVGNIEYLNHSSAAVGSIAAKNVSQTFSIMQEGSFAAFNAPIPAGSPASPAVVEFSAYFNVTGSIEWMTMAPTDDTSMMTPGLMTGTMTVE